MLLDSLGCAIETKNIASILRLQTDNWLNIGFKWVVLFNCWGSLWPLKSFFSLYALWREAARWLGSHMKMILCTLAVWDHWTAAIRRCTTHISSDPCEQLLRNTEWNVVASCCSMTKPIYTLLIHQQNVTALSAFFRHLSQTLTHSFRYQSILVCTFSDPVTLHWPLRQHSTLLQPTVSLILYVRLHCLPVLSKRSAQAIILFTKQQNCSC